MPKTFTIVETWTRLHEVKAEDTDGAFLALNRKLSATANDSELCTLMKESGFSFESFDLLDTLEEGDI